jgi:hypothetical protein
MDLAAIRIAVAAQIVAAVNATTDPGLKVNGYGHPPDSPELNAILVFPRPFDDGQYVTHHGTFGNGLCEIGLRVEIRVGGPNEDAARRMDAYLGSGAVTSVIDAIETSPTIGGLVQDCYMSGASVPARFVNPDDGREWLASSIDLQVRARRS